MKKGLFVSLLAFMVLLAGCGTSSNNEKNNSSNTGSEAVESEDSKMVTNGDYPQLSTEVKDNERLVEMETTFGTIKIKLFPDYAPKTVENFIAHSKNGYYEGLTFHRVMNDFMIQGGDPEGTGGGGESSYGEPFEDEFSTSLFHIRGALSMANSGPNTNGSQFFIVQNQSPLDEGLKGQMEKAGYPAEILSAYENGGAAWLDFGHTVFGQVVEGMDVVDKIASVPVSTEAETKDKPLEDVVIKKVTVIQ
ncbi:peptidylprolyl isomerase [Mesobacillus harenae]|uniref:peptidylprolyl isomerase n=1 Tax=Mesobacillus harenae TaxID=2213203 RepID=UPI0015811198|nr:peptidylprolyl isomerase [Mesobacillus harenae]